MSSLTLQHFARTKIVATVGPACESAEMLEQLVIHGADVFRINMAHGSRASHEAVIARIRAVSDKLDRPLGILVDLAGPKIRLGELHTDPIMCELGEEFEFVRGDQASHSAQLVSNYLPLIDELSVGDSVMLADGTVAMRVVRRETDQVVCKVVGAGLLRSRQGINLPGVSLSVPSLTEQDLDNAAWAAGQDIDFVSLSFVRRADEIRDLKALLTQHGSTALVIAKIEKREALDNLQEIVLASDGVMVARGDLGVEIDVAETPLAQKRIVAVCQQLTKPVIVATQMLDSMQQNPRPTRAEVSDVANAIFDGADACMLSGETAIGKYPVRAVEMMNRIMLNTERSLHDAPSAPLQAPSVSGVQPITSAVVYGASQIAEKLFAKLVVVASRSGATARVKAKLRNFIPTIGVSSSERTLRRMTLFWGIMPLRHAPAEMGPKLRDFIDSWGLEDGILKLNDRVVFVTGSALIRAAHNTVVVHEVGGDAAHS